MRLSDAKLAIATAVAEDMYQNAPQTLRPDADPRLVAMGLTITHHVTAVDQLLDFGTQRVSYGFVATAPAGDTVVAIRGTERAIEWAKDAEGAKRPHPVAGEVHMGFWDIYQSMRLLPADADEQPLSAGIEAALAKGARVVVCGHSLGGPLATYAAYDLATLKAFSVAARLFASPRPGDAAFCDATSSALPDHVSYAYEPDVVPRVPFGFGYSHLANHALLAKNPAIPDGLSSCHHALNYAWLLDPSSVPGGPV